jgi:hypothetical protein
VTIFDTGSLAVCSLGESRRAPLVSISGIGKPIGTAK